MAEGEWLAVGLINMGECFIQLNQPDSLIRYYQAIVDKMIIMDHKKARKVYMTLTNAYQFKEQPEKANQVYLQMRRHGFELEPGEIWQWTGTMEKIAAYLIKKINLGGVPDYHAALFLLRYCTLKQDAELLRTVYGRILSTKFEPAQWSSLLEFAKVCGQNEYLQAMLKKALDQHPDSRVLLEFENQAPLRK